MVPIEMSSPHPYSTYVHTIGLSYTVWPQYTAQRSDIAIGIGRLGYSIGGLIIVAYLVIEPPCLGGRVIALRLLYLFINATAGWTDGCIQV